MMNEPTLSRPDPPDPAAPAAGEAAIAGIQPPCRKLRTKLAFSALVTEDGTPLRWQKGDGSTAVYWCLATMECAGPDNGLVHATECTPGRMCYVSQMEPQPPAARPSHAPGSDLQRETVAKSVLE